MTFIRSGEILQRCHNTSMFSLLLIYSVFNRKEIALLTFLTFMSWVIMVYPDYIENVHNSIVMNYIVTCQAHPVLVKSGWNVRSVSFKNLKIRANIRPVLLRQGEPGTPQYIPWYTPVYKFPILSVYHKHSGHKC